MKSVEELYQKQAIVVTSCSDGDKSGGFTSVLESMEVVIKHESLNARVKKVLLASQTRKKCCSFWSD